MTNALTEMTPYEREDWDAEAEERAMTPTPGPWIAVGNRYDYEMGTPGTEGRHLDKWIATIKDVNTGLTTGITRKNEVLANIKLITAAPDLLEACEEAERVLTGMFMGEMGGEYDCQCEGPNETYPEGFTCNLCGVRRALQSVIAKATGQAVTSAAQEATA